MGFQPSEFKPPLSTPPKLSLYSLPSKPTTLPDGLTPPLNTVATIPFLWEEAPGKPRATDDPPKSKAVRSLDLPPRLTTTTTVPSPTTVLSGPYVMGSPEKAVVGGSKISNKGKMRMPLRKLMRKDRSPEKWELDTSFKDDNIIEDGDRSVKRSPSLRFCSWRWDSFRDTATGGGGGGSLCSSFDDRRNKSLDSGDKIRKVLRKNSSFTFPTNTSSTFLVNMYGTFKKAMSRRSRR